MLDYVTIDKASVVLAPSVPTFGVPRLGASAQVKLPLLPQVAATSREVARDAIRVATDAAREATRASAGDAAVWPGGPVGKAIIATIVVVYCLTAGLAQARDPRTEKALENDSTIPVEVHIDGKLGTPQFITGKFPHSLMLSKEAVAKKFLEDHRATLGVPASHTFETIKIFADGDYNTVVRLSQQVGGVPIFESDVAVNINAANDVRVVSGKFYTVDFDTVATIDKETAIASAGYLLGDPDLIEMPSAELVGYVRDKFGVLTWHVVLTTIEPSGALGQWHYFINARNGDLVNFYNGIRHVLDRETYDMNNTTTLSLATLEIVEGGVSKDKVTQATHDNVATVYDYYLTNHGRDGMDGLGGTIETYVHWGDSFVGAFYGRLNDHGAMAFGDGNPKTMFPYGTALDVVAHEYTHGVIDFTARVGFSEQSTALNESLADVFAMFVDTEDFLLGEDLFQDETRALESISDPLQQGNQPDHMSAYRLDAVSPFLDPHRNGGITNKAFFNIVSALDRPDTAKIYYRALTVYMTTSTDFAGARLALEQAASDLFGPDSVQRAAVESGFNAVGIYQPPGDFVGVFVADPDPLFPPADSNGLVSKTFTHSGASAMKVNFSSWAFPGRTVYIKDGTGTVIYTYDSVGALPGGFTSGPVHGDTITVEFYPVADMIGSMGFPTVDGYFYNDLDFTPPAFSAVTVTIVDHFTATMSWLTDERADSQVRWGETLAYGNTTPLQPFKTFNHSVTLDMLMPGTTYNAVATSVDFSGNIGSSDNLTFSIPAATDVVIIDRADWPAFDELRVRATSTDPLATVTVYFGDGRFIGTMDADGKGGHRLRTSSFINTRSVDSKIMLRSSAGGFDTHMFPAL